MTRINCVPVEELHNKHLVAEYRELPRVFKLAEAAWARGVKPEVPDEYVLGKGHVQFFYDKLGFVENRFRMLVGEMLRRGYRPSYTEPPHADVPPSWYAQWQPDGLALQINRARIQDRIPGG